MIKLISKIKEILKYGALNKSIININKIKIILFKVAYLIIFKIELI